MKEPYPSATRCTYELCKRSDPIEVTPGHRRRQYHDENCRQAQHRLLEARRIYETLCQVWAPFLPETQQVLEDLLGEHGEIWTRCVIAAITAERDQAGRPSLSEDEQAALRQQWADLQPFTRNILEGLLTQQHERFGLLNLITLAIGEERTHAMCNSELEQRAAYLEIMLAEYRRIIDLEDEEKIGQQFMAMGELLGYRALPSYRLGEEIERWKDYRSWTDERTLAEVIVYGRELLAQEAAVKENAAQKSKMRQAEQRLVALEQRTKEQQERIAELEEQLAREHEQATDAADLLIAIQEAGRKIVDLERQAELHDQARIELEAAQTQAEEGRDQVQRRFRDYVRMTNEKLGQLSGELAKFRQEREHNQDAREVEEQERLTQRIAWLEQEVAECKQRLEEKQQPRAVLSAEQAHEHARLHGYLNEGAYLASTQRLFVRVFQTGQVEPHEMREVIHQERGAENERLRHRIAELEREVTQQGAMNEAQEQNIENYRKKLAQASERISKLERQVDVQRQQLGQYHQRFYPSSRAVAEQRLMALGAALNYKILLKYDNVAVEVPSGEQAWREFATHASYEDLAQAILQALYLFDNLQALGMLAKRDSLVDHE